MAPVLDRQIHFDPRSRSFAAPTTDRPRSYTWRLGQETLDQGNDGHCVGFSISHEAAARPSVRSQDKQAAHAAFYVAQTIDRREGRHFPDGATCLAGMKAGVELGWWDGYVWSFGVDHLARSVQPSGPAVLGTWWYTSMFVPDDEGRFTVGGSRAGGHAYLCVGFDTRTGDFLCANSWGTGWSKARWRGKTLPGHFVVSYEQMGRLLTEDGEAATPTGRK